MSKVDSSKWVSLYVDDFGNEYSNVPFKFEAIDGLTDIINQYDDRSSGIICSNTALFKMRKMIITMTTGNSIELPIPTLEEVDDYIGTALSGDGVACVGLRGEGWANIPPAKIGANYKNSSIVTAGTRNTRETWNYDYTIDGSGGTVIKLKTNFQVNPEPIYNAQKKCLANAALGSGICVAGGSALGLEPRRFVGKIKTDDSDTSSIARQIIVSANTNADIKQCGADVSAEFNCLAYYGQSVVDASTLYEKV